MASWVSTAAFPLLSSVFTSHPPHPSFSLSPFPAFQRHSPLLSHVYAPNFLQSFPYSLPSAGIPLPLMGISSPPFLIGGKLQKKLQINQMRNQRWKSLCSPASQLTAPTRPTTPHHTTPHPNLTQKALNKIHDGEFGPKP